MPFYASLVPRADSLAGSFLTPLGESICRETDSGIDTQAKSLSPVCGPILAAHGFRLFPTMKPCRTLLLAREAWS